MNDVVLHAFNWSYREVAQQAEAIARAGYGAVLFAPPFHSDENGREWWQVYQPRDYRVLRSHLGRKLDLEDAVRALKSVGVRCYVDVVFNHMANESRDDRFRFPGKAVMDWYRREPAEFEKDRLYGDLSTGLFDEHDFHPCRDISDWSDEYQLIHRELSGLPDLVLSIAVVREQIRCLEALVAMGFDGFRVDAVKHLPMDHVRDVFQSRPMRGKFVFGETLTFDDRQNDEFLWPAIRSTAMSFYDFPLQQTLVESFRPGGSLCALVDPASCANALPWDRGVTFTVTHDVPNNDGFRGMLLDPHDEYLANAYVLGRDGGVALIYSDHGESAGKYPQDRGRWEQSWQRYDIVQMIRFHNAVQGQDQRSLWESNGCIAFARGDKGIVAINKSSDWAHLEIPTWGLRWGDFRCQIHQHVMRVEGDWFRFAVPPRQTQMWLFEG